jgi:hypothetical protein
MRSRLLCCVCGMFSCSLGNNEIGDAGAAALAAALVHLPQLQTLEYVVCPSVRARSLCALAPERGAMLVFTIVCCCVCGLCSCVCRLCSRSLGHNGIGAAGAAAIGAGLVHLPQLQTLEYVVCPAVRVGPWCVCLHGNAGAVACVCAVFSGCAVCVRAAFVSTLSATRVRWLLVQAWFTCPSCRHWSTLCAGCVCGAVVCVLAWERGGRGMRSRLCCCVWGMYLRSLRDNDIGAAGAAAIGAGLVHLPQLQTLTYVVRPTVCVRGRGMCLLGIKEQWRVFAPVIVSCVRHLFVQP